MNIRKAICSVLAALLIMAAPSAFATGGSNPSASPEQTAAPTASVSTTKAPFSWSTPEPSPSPTPTPTPIPSPTPGELEITKSPENENVKPGGTASFITQAVNYTSCKWYLSKDGETVEADRAEERFPGLKVAGDGTEKLILSAIPKSLDGWSVYCVFKGAAGSVSTSKARLHVSDSAKPKPTQIPAAAVTQSPVVTLVPTAEPMQTAAPHVHSFSAQWKSDDTRHWQECECGEKVNLADHVVAEWTTIAEATKEQDGIDEGTCAVCGRTVQRSTAYRPSTTGRIILAAVMALIIAIAIVRKMQRNSRKRWRLR